MQPELGRCPRAGARRRQRGSTSAP